MSECKDCIIEFLNEFNNLQTYGRTGENLKQIMWEQKDIVGQLLIKKIENDFGNSIFDEVDKKF